MVIEARRSARGGEALCVGVRWLGSDASGFRNRTSLAGRRAPTEYDFRFRAEEKLAFGLAAVADLVQLESAGEERELYCSRIGEQLRD